MILVLRRGGRFCFSAGPNGLNIERVMMEWWL